MLNLELVFGCLIMAIVGGLTTLFLAVQFILALVHRRRHLNWSVLWIVGWLCLSTGLLMWLNEGSTRSDAAIIVGALLTIPVPTRLWLLALFLFVVAKGAS